MARTFRHDVATDGAGGSYEELLYHDPAFSAALITAPRGGIVEPHTDSQALALSSRLFRTSVWCRRWDAESGEQAGVPTSDLLRSAYSTQFEYLVSFRGTTQRGVQLSGFASESLKQALVEELDQTLDAPVSWVSKQQACESMTEIEALAGVIQLNQGPHVREEAWSQVVDVVTDVLHSELGDQTERV